MTISSTWLASSAATTATRGARGGSSSETSLVSSPQMNRFPKPAGAQVVVVAVAGQTRAGDDEPVGHALGHGLDDHQLHVGAVEGFDDHLAILENSQHLVGAQAQVVGLDDDIGVDAAQVLPQGDDLFLPHLVQEIILAVEVFLAHDVEIGDDQVADPGAGEGHGAVGAKAAAAGYADTGIPQFFKL